MARKLPKGWKAYEFDDVATIASGQADPRKAEFSELPLVGSENLPSGGGDLIGEILSAKKIGAISGKYLFKPRQVIYSKIRPNLNKLWLSSFDGLCSADIYPITFDEERVLPEYAYYFMLGDQFRKIAVSASMRSGIPKVNRDDLSSAIIAAPSTVEQRRIVRVLDAADRLIRLERVHTEHLHQLRRAVVSRSISLANAERAKKLALSELADVRMSGVDKKTVQGESVVLLCNYMDVFYNEVINEEVDFMRASATQTEIDRFTLRQGDVLLTKDSEVADEIAECAVVESDLPGVLCGYHLALLRPDKKRVLGQYLAIALREPHVRHQFARCANGVTRFGLTLDAFDQIEIALPGLKEQQKVAEIYATLSKRINASKWLAEQLVEQKRGLMQQLLTGQHRLTRDLPGMEPGDV